MKFRSFARLVLFAALLLGSAAFAAFGPAILKDAVQAEDEITYTMPTGWVAQALQGGPDLKAHYVLMSGGRPYGEMYLSQTPAATGQTLDLIFEEGLARVRPQLPYYQARSTRKTTIGGVPAVAHEFSYMPNGAGVLFIGRTYTLVSGSTVFTFFFQSLGSYFPSTQGSFSQIMAGVRLVPKPAPAPVNPAAGNVAAKPAVLTPGGGLLGDDMGLNFELPAVWRLVDDPQGAKYRCFGPGGSITASLFILPPEESAGLTALFGGTEDNTLTVALSTKVDREFKSYQRYTPVATVKRDIGRYKGLVHDFTFLLDNRPVFYRWVIFAVPRKADNPNVRVAPGIQPFAFLGYDAGRAAEYQRQWNAIMDSMRDKGDPALFAPPEPADRGGLGNPPVRPPEKIEGGLPDLQLDEPEAGFYAEPFGRSKVHIPEGAVQTKVEENAAYYRMPSPRTTFIIHSYPQEETGRQLVGRYTEGRKLNGAPSAVKVGEREATVSLYTARDPAGESMVWVVALYPKSGLLIVVNLPAKDYAGAKDWISALVRGVRF